MAITEKIPPEWNAPGIEPPDSKKQSGFAADDLVPAGWLNWFMSGVSAFLLDAKANGASMEWVQEQINKIAIPLIDSNTSTSKTSAPTADALRRTVESMAEALALKQDTLRLADNYLAASVLVNAAPDTAGRAYPNGVSMFKVTSAAGGWPAANGYVLTFRAGSGGYQIFYEMYTGNVQTDKTARQWTRSKRDSNTFWQDFARDLTEIDMAVHAGDASKHSYWGGTTTGDGTNVTNPAYMATVPGVQTTGALPDGFAVTVVLNVANGGGDAFLRINNCNNYAIRRNATTQFAGGTLKAGQLISLVKVGNYFLARSAAPTGNATPATVLAGSTFMSETSPDGATGTVPVLTGVRVATGAALWADRGLAVYPERGFQKGGAGDGEIKVLIDQLAAAEPNLIPANIRAGTNIFGKVGSLTEVKQFSQTYGYTNGVLTINFGFVPRIIGVSILKADGFVRGAFLMASVDGRTDTISSRDANNNPDVYLNGPFVQTVGMSIYNANQVKVIAFS